MTYEIIRKTHLAKYIDIAGNGLVDDFKLAIPNCNLSKISGNANISSQNTLK